MDDAQMQEARAKAIIWLDQHWPTERRICPIDQNLTWALTDLVQLNRFTPESVMRGEVYPAIQVVCRTCGYMVHFNAITAGIVQGVDPYRAGASGPPVDPTRP